LKTKNLIILFHQTFEIKKFYNAHMEYGIQNPIYVFN